MRAIGSLIFSMALVLVSSGPAQASFLPSGLYGWTRHRDSAGKIDFVSVSESDGHASFLFDMAVPNGYEARDLSYDPTNGHFYGSIFPVGGGSFLIADINPVTMSLTYSTYSGLLVDFVEGMEYFQAKGAVVVSGTDAGGTNALYVVSHAGVVQETAVLPQIRDQDHLGANSSGGELHVLDTNHPTNGFLINQWVDPLSATPTLVGVYNGPDSWGAVDLAINPLTGAFYSSGLTRLLRYDFTLQQQEVVGEYNYRGEIWGIAAVGAAVPEPASLTLFGLGTLGIGFMARRRRRAAPRPLTT